MKNKILNIDNNINFFARHLILDNFGEKKQKILSKSHVTFVGIGGINSPSIIYLLSMGIKKITIIDFDIVQKSNLNRQIIFSKNDVGKSKIFCTEKFIKNNYENILINSYKKKLTIKNCNQLIKNTDIVIDGSDNWSTMLCLNDYCVKNNIPLLSSSVSGYDGNIILFENNKNYHLCLRCIFPLKKDVNLPRCETVGVLGTSAGVIGILSAHKVINFLTIKKRNQKNSKILYFDGRDSYLKEINIFSNPKCKFINK